jgi:hypothetical protein
MLRLTNRDAQEILADFGYWSLSDFSQILDEEWEIVRRMEEKYEEERI